MEAINTMEEVDIVVTNPVIAAKEDAVNKTTEIGVEAVVFESTVILHITVEHTECVPTREKTAGTW